MGRTEHEEENVGNRVGRCIKAERLESEREGARCMKVQRSTEQEIGKLN